MHFSDILLVLIFLTILLSLGSNRLMELVKVMAVQGVLVSLVPLVIGTHHELNTAGIAILAMMLAIKSILIPGSLYYAVKRIINMREIETIIGYQSSIFIGLGLILLSYFVSVKLQTIIPPTNHLLLPAGFTTLAAGLFLMMARRKAITQVIGYLMLENGIYLIGSVIAQQTHTQYLIECGILLDLLAGVMIMGIILHRINHSYDDVDTKFLSELKG